MLHLQGSREQSASLPTQISTTRCGILNNHPYSFTTPLSNIDRRRRIVWFLIVEEQAVAVALCVHLGLRLRAQSYLSI
jgi:hypothetical protein